MAEKRKDANGRVLRSGEYYNANTGVYQYRKMIDGKRSTITDKSLDNLRKRAKEMEVALDRGLNVQHGNKTLNQYFGYWMENDASGSVKPGTLINYRSYYNTYVKGGLGKKRIDRIKKSDVQAVFNGMIKDGLSRSTMSNLKACLNNIFESAIDDDAIFKNPVKNIKLPNTGAKKREAVESDQVALFLSYIQSHKTYEFYVPFFTTLFSTGMRIGEIAGLTWDNVDMQEQTITIDKAIIRTRAKEFGFTRALTSPKSQTSKRVIPFNNDIKKLLLKQWQQNKLVHSGQEKLPYMDDAGRVTKYYSDFVFLNINGTVWTDPTVIATIKRIVERQNKGARDGEELLQYFSPHSARHTYTTLAYGAGVDIKAVSASLGHASTKVTMDVYTHLSGEKLKEQHEMLRSIKIS